MASPDRKLLGAGYANRRGRGEILGALDDSGAAANIIVVFTSDHGDMMGNHHLHAKHVMYDDAARIPLLLHVPC